MKNLRFALFILASLLILTAVAWNMVCSEITLRYGSLHRMKIQGFDPHDPFRGRYLAFAMPSAARDGGFPEQALTGYVTVERGADGMSYFGTLTATAPDGGSFLRVRRRYPRRREPKSFEPPFSRFYLNEKLAPEAERILNEALRDPARQAVIAFRVHRGRAAPADLEIDGRSIAILAREAAAGKNTAPPR